MSSASTRFSVSVGSASEIGGVTPNWLGNERYEVVARDGIYSTHICSAISMF